MREKHVKPTNQENTVHGPRWDLNLIHLTNQTTQGALEKTQHTSTSWVQLLSRSGSKLPAVSAHGEW